MKLTLDKCSTKIQHLLIMGKMNFLVCYSCLEGDNLFAKRLSSGKSSDFDGKPKQETLSAL